jgi:hypothetical protein
MPQTVTRDTNRLALDEGVIEIPYDKDSAYSVTFTFFKGTTATTGLHWHENKTGMTTYASDNRLLWDISNDDMMDQNASKFFRGVHSSR